MDFRLHVHQLLFYLLVLLRRIIFQVNAKIQISKVCHVPNYLC